MGFAIISKKNKLVGRVIKVMMKKVVYRCIGVLLFMAMLCGCAAQGNSGDIGSDAGTLASSTLASSTEVSVSLLSEDVTEESVNKVKDAWQRLSEIVPLSDTEFAIGPANKHLKRDGLINFTEREIADDNFNEIFIDKCTDLSYWKIVGLSEYAFDYTPVNTEDEVKEYLDKREEKTLPLFALFFFEEFTEESDLQMSRDCAYYLTKYALEKYSYNDFLENEYRSEWLAGLGSTADFRFDEIDEVVEASTAEKKGPIVYVTCAGNTWKISEVEWIKTADDVYCILHETEDGIRKLCKRIASESDIYDEESFRKDVTVITTDKHEHSFTKGGVIELGNPFHFIHEYVHCTLSYNLEETWLVDGLAVYYSNDYENDYVYNHDKWDDVKHKWFDEGIMDDENKAIIEQDGTMEYEETKREYYLKLREKDKDQNNQYFCFEYANGLADLTYFGTEMYENSEQRLSISETYDLLSHGTADRLGNDLTYFASMVVTADIIAKYGVDSIISSSGSFEEDFGMTSDEYIQNYLDNKLYMHFLDE